MAKKITKKHVALSIMRLSFVFRKCVTARNLIKEKEFLNFLFDLIFNPILFQEWPLETI